jgi:hypothetical protein
MLAISAGTHSPQDCAWPWVGSMVFAQDAVILAASDVAEDLLQICDPLRIPD